MNILILNWRDIRHPSGGGAEILTHELAKRLVKAGHTVTQFCSGFSGCRHEEVIDGVLYVRRGRWWSVHVLAWFYYFWLMYQKNTDLVIDEVHWFPFFSVAYTQGKTILLACEVANKRLFTLFPYPVAVFMRFLEKIYLHIYKNIPTLVISPSTKEELQKEGFKEKNITILPMGLTIPNDVVMENKETNPTVIYLGRIFKLKGIEDAVDAFVLIQKEIPGARFWIVGSGHEAYVRKIKEKIQSLGLTDAVTFFGFVDERKKFSLLSKAHVLIFPSVHEGWGLIVPEAGKVGTPTVAYNVAGLRDVVKDEKAGLLVTPNYHALANGVIRLLRDKKLYDNLRNGAIMLSKEYNWDNTAKVTLSFIEKTI